MKNCHLNWKKNKTRTVNVGYSDGLAMDNNNIVRNNLKGTVVWRRIYLRSIPLLRYFALSFCSFPPPPPPSPLPVLLCAQGCNRTWTKWTAFSNFFVCLYVVSRYLYMQPGAFNAVYPPRANDAFPRFSYFPLFENPNDLFQRNFCLLSTKISDDILSHFTPHFKLYPHFLHFPLFSLNLRVFCVIYVFLSPPYFDHGAFMRTGRPCV